MKKIDILVNIEESNYMQSSAYYSQLEAALE